MGRAFYYHRSVGRSRKPIINSPLDLALRARARAPSGLPDASSSAASANPRRASTRGVVRLRSSRTCLATLQSPAAELRRAAAELGLHPAGRRARIDRLIRKLTRRAATDRHFGVDGVRGPRRRKAGECRGRRATSARTPTCRARTRACPMASRWASTTHGRPGAPASRCAARRGRWAAPSPPSSTGRTGRSSTGPDDGSHNTHLVCHKWGRSLGQVISMYSVVGS